MLRGLLDLRLAVIEVIRGNFGLKVKVIEEHSKQAHEIFCKL